MDRIGTAAAWITVAVGSASGAVAWTGIALLFMHWPLHTLATAVVLGCGIMAVFAIQDRYRQLGGSRQPAPFVLPDRPLELTDLVDALGEATYQELSQLTRDRVNE